jgi:hypothetical protein
MPNWVRNEVTINGSKEDIAKLEKAVATEQYPFSFEAYYPMPESLNIVSGFYEKPAITLFFSQLESRELVDLFEKYGEDKILELIREYKTDVDPKILRKDKSPHGVVLDGSTRPQCKEDYIAYGEVYAKNILEHGCSSWFDWCCYHWGTKWDVLYPVLQSSTDTQLVYEFDTAWSFPEGALKKLGELFPDVTIEDRFADEDLCGGNCGVFYMEGGQSDIEYKDYEFACEVWGWDPEEEEEE